MNLKEIPIVGWITIGLFALIIGVVVTQNSDKSETRTSNPATSQDTAKAKIKPDTVEKHSNWSYDTVKDEMTSGSIITAKTEATNTFEFNPPYDGYNSAEIQIRRKRGTTDVIFSIQKGQFIGGVEGQNVKVRFDQKKYSEYFCNPASDYDPTILFVDDTGDFIEHLKHSKKLLIEANIYDNGFQQFEFSVDGFEWNTPHHHRPNKTIIYNYPQ